MERRREQFGFKSLLYSSVAALALTVTASAQERMPSQTQDRPAATQSQNPSSQPSAQPDRGQQDRAPQERNQQVQDRSEKGQGASGQGTSGQATPSRSGAETESNKSRTTQDRDAQSPADSKSQQQRSQSDETQRDRGNQQKQSRDEDRPRDKQQTQSRDSERTQQRNQSATPDRQRNQDNAQSPQNRDGENATRDSARSGDNNRQAAQPTEQQRTRISASIRQADVEPVRNVNFSVSVGTTIPTSVRLHRVTPAIVEVYPQYRDYSFTVVDERIVIIEPRTKRIVTVIDQGGGSARTGSVSRSKLTLSDKQRDVIRRSATERRTTGSGSRAATMEREITVGEELPETVEIESFPETVYTEVPEIRSYRYIVRDRDVYVVDPTERRVIEVIR